MADMKTFEVTVRVTIEKCLRVNDEPTEADARKIVGDMVDAAIEETRYWTGTGGTSAATFLVNDTTSIRYAVEVKD